MNQSTANPGKENHVSDLIQGDLVRGDLVRGDVADRAGLDAKFDEALRFVDRHWTLFEDPAGVSADIEELRRAVSVAAPADTTRTRLTLHRLRRSAGTAGPVAAIVAAVRAILTPM